MQLLSRILLISDFHWMVVPLGQQKGQVITGISRLVEGVINIWKRWNNPNIEKALFKVSGLGKFDQVIMLGDLVECIYNERGIITKKDEEAISVLKLRLHSFFPGSRVQYVPGDHELGYKLPLSSDPKCGMSFWSLRNYREVIGPLYKYFQVGSDKFHFFLVSSSLLHQKVRGSPKEIQETLQLKKWQEEFLFRHLVQVGDGEKVFVFLHDPDSLESLDMLLPEDLVEKITQVFCGHMHAEDSLAKYERLGRIANSWLAPFISRHKKGRKIMEWARGNLHRLEIFKKYNLQIVPALGGMMGSGGGFLVLNLFEDGNYTVEKHRT